MEPAPASAPNSGELDLGADRRKRGVRIGIAVVVLAAAGVGGAVFLDRRENRATDERLHKSWSALAQCIAGPASSVPPAVAFRRIQLTAMAMPGEKRREPGGAEWPHSCSKPAYALHAELVDAARSKKDERDLAALSEGFAKMLDSTKDAVSKNLSEPIDALFQRAATEGLADGSTASPTLNADALTPPRASTGLTLATLTASGGHFSRLSKTPFALKSVGLEQHRHPQLRFLIDDKALTGGPFLCAATSSPPKLSCKKLPDAAIATNAPLVLSGSHLGDTPPLVLAGDAGDAGVFRTSDGGKVGAPMKFGWATVDAAGTATTLGYDATEKKIRLTRQNKGDSSPVSTEPKLPGKAARENPYYAASIVGDTVFWRGATDTDESAHLFAQTIAPIGSAGDGLAAAVDVGEVGGWYAQGPQQFKGCITAAGDLFVRVEGNEGMRLASRAAGKWGAPIDLVGGTGAMTCKGNVLTFTSVSGWESIIASQSRCAAGSCSPTTAKIDLPEILKPRLASGASVSGKSGDAIVLVYIGGDQGGVRYRVGDIKELKDADDRVLFDDHEQGDGATATLSDVSDVYEVGTYALDDVALVLLSTKQGVYPLAIDAAGNVSPVAVDGAF